MELVLFGFTGFDLTSQIVLEEIFTNSLIAWSPCTPLQWTRTLGQYGPCTFAAVPSESYHVYLPFAITRETTRTQVSGATPADTVEETRPT